MIVDERHNGGERQRWTMQQIEQYELQDCERIEVKG